MRWLTNRLNLVGQRFGRLVVIDFAEIRNNRSFWNCLCDCGNKKIAMGKYLRRGGTTSCGCAHKELISKLGKSNTTHGKHNTKVYRIWSSMLRRCTNPSHVAFKRYGGRGIKVCKRWLKFENFFEDMGYPPEKYSLDRIDNNKGYNKKNCRWATWNEQANNRRNNTMLTYKGDTKTQSEWAAETGFSSATICYRLKSGWSVEKALTTPLQTKEKRITKKGNGI